MVLINEVLLWTDSLWAQNSMGAILYRNCLPYSCNAELVKSIECHFLLSVPIVSCCLLTICRG